MSNSSETGSYNYKENRYTTPEEQLDWWKIKTELCKSLSDAGFLELLDLDRENLTDTILRQAKQIQDTEDSEVLYNELLKRIDETMKEINKLNNDNAHKATALNQVVEKMKKFGTHTDTCAIYDGLETGRILDQKECDCGWVKYREKLEE